LWRGSNVDGPQSSLEDSETPWMYALVLSGLRGAVGATQTTATTSEPIVRVRVLTFSQTPHHSKVAVALLKVLFPLPDVAVDQFRVCCRAARTQDTARPYLSPLWLLS
jgi:hypothetical protein